MKNKTKRYLFDFVDKYREYLIFRFFETKKRTFINRSIVTHQNRRKIIHTKKIINKNIVLLKNLFDLKIFFI